MCSEGVMVVIVTRMLAMVYMQPSGCGDRRQNSNHEQNRACATHRLRVYGAVPRASNAAREALRGRPRGRPAQNARLIPIWKTAAESSCLLESER